MGPPTGGQPLHKGHCMAMAPIEIIIVLAIAYYNDLNLPPEEASE